MKLMATLLLFSFIYSSVGNASIFLQEEVFDDCRYSLDACAYTTTSLPTAIIESESELSNDDSMTQLADEITGQVDSTEMIDKIAKHFETSAYMVVSAASDLLDTEEGLSFEGLKEELQ